MGSGKLGRLQLEIFASLLANPPTSVVDEQFVNMKHFATANILFTSRDIMTVVTFIALVLGHTKFGGSVRSIFNQNHKSCYHLVWW